MKKTDRDNLINILSTNTGAPITVKFGHTFTEGGTVNQEAIVLVDCHAGMIKKLHEAGYTLSLHNGVLITNKH